MKILIENELSYTFTKEGDSFFLSVVCGSIGLYEMKIKLTDAEVAEYNDRGAAYIDELAERIRYNPPEWASRDIV